MLCPLATISFISQKTRTAKNATIDQTAMIKVVNQYVTFECLLVHYYDKCDSLKNVLLKTQQINHCVLELT